MSRLILFIVSFLCYTSMSSQEIIDSSFVLDSINIHYDSDIFTLGQVQIDSLHTFLNAVADKEIHYVIESYTDSDGSVDYNYKLAQKRSAGVELVLTSMNVEIDKITKDIFGETKLSTTENNETEKAYNRRTVLKARKNVQFRNVNVNILSNEEDTLIDPQITLYYEGRQSNIKVTSPRNIQVPIPLDYKVEMHFLAQDHFPIIKRLKLNAEKDPLSIKIPLKKMSLDSMMVTRIQFKGGRSVLLDFSYPELFSLASSLNKSNNICVELLGHVHHDFGFGERSTGRDGLSIARSTEVYDLSLIHI